MGVDNASPATTTAVTVTKDTKEQMTVSFTNPITSDLESILVLRSTQNVADTPTEGVTYTAGNTIGASTVLCVKTSPVLGARDSCVFTTPLRSQRYYFKVFTKDTTGNYSSVVTPTGSPLIITTPNGGSFSLEHESWNGGTATTTGGTTKGGTGQGTDTGTTTTATTTTSTTTPVKGGGGGDVGIKYQGSTLAQEQNRPSVSALFAKLLGKSLSYGSLPAQASTNNEGQVPKLCLITIASHCVLGKK